VTQAGTAPDPEEVSSALRRRLGGRFPGGVADAEAPVRISGGLDFWVYGLHFAGPGLPAQWGAPLVARICERPGRFPLLERESRLQAWVAEHGYPAPPVLDLVPPGELLEFPVQVMERAPHRTQRLALRAIAPALSRAYLAAYRRQLPVDAARLQLWVPVHLLRAWAMFAAAEQEPWGGSRRPELIAWARRQFWRRVNALPLGRGAAITSLVRTRPRCRSAP
jgi:hypothetical protein